MQGRVGLCTAAFQGPPQADAGPDEKQHLIPGNVSAANAVERLA